MKSSSTTSKTPVSGQEWNTYRRLIRYAYPYVTRLLLGAVFGIVCGGSTVGLLLSLKKTLAAIFDPQSLPWPVIVATVVLLPLFGLLLGVGNYLSTYFVAWVGNRVVMDLRTELFAHIHQLPLLYFSQSKTGELISRTTNDTLQIERAVSTVMIDLVREPFVLMASVGYLFWLDARLALLSLVLFPVCIVPVALFGRRVRRFAREGQQKLADITSTLQETITGVKIVKAYGMEENGSRTGSAEQAKAVFGRVMKVTRASAAIDPIVVSISFVGLSLALLYARWVGMTFDQFFTFGAALVMMYQPVKKISKLNMAIQQGSGAADRIFELRDAPVVKDVDGAVDFDETVRTVEFRGVSFAYGDEPVLKEVGFTVSAGQCIAFVGSSGSGKSTLVSLLPRFFDVQSGQVLINGKDSRTFTLKSLRRQIGIVTQETILFNDTVASNIAYGQTGASRAAIEEAARRAHAHEFIAADAAGLRHGDRGARAPPVRRPVPAAGDRARDPAQPADPDPRRGDERAGHGVRAPGSGGAGRTHDRPDRFRDRAPVVHDHARGPDPGAGQGLHRGAGDASGTARPRRLV